MTDPELLSWIERGQLIATLLVAIGVAGEFAGSFIARPINRRVEAARQLEIAKATTKSEEARRDIAAAGVRIAEAEQATTELAAKNLALEVAIAPRRLSDRQQKELSALTAFSGRLVGIKSYSVDTEGAIFATQIINALTKSTIRIEDNRFTMGPASTVVLGVSVEGPDKALVAELKRILSMDGNLTAVSSITTGAANLGFSTSTSFGVISGGQPPAAIIVVGAKPIK